MHFITAVHTIEITGVACIISNAITIVLVLSEDSTVILYYKSVLLIPQLLLSSSV